MALAVDDRGKYCLGATTSATEVLLSAMSDASNSSLGSNVEAIMVFMSGYFGGSDSTFTAEWGDGTNWQTMHLKAHYTGTGAYNAVSVFYLDSDDPVDLTHDRFRFTSSASAPEGVVCGFVSVSAGAGNTAVLVDGCVDATNNTSSAAACTLTGGASGDLIVLGGEEYGSTPDVTVQSQTALSGVLTGCQGESCQMAYKDWSSGATIGCTGDWSSVGGCAFTEVAGSTVVNRTLNDVVDINDSQTRVAQVFRQLIDTLNVDDLIIRSVLATRILNDNIDINDSLTSAVLSIYTRVLSDSIDVNDNQIRLEQIFRALSDSIVIADNQTRIAEVFRQLSDNIDIYDLLTSTSTVVYSRILMDYITISDSISRYRNLLALLTDSVDINDSYLRYLNAFHILSDAIDINDSLTVEQILPGVISRILQDSIDVNDASTRIVLAFHILQDSIAINDSLIHFIQNSRLLQDTLSVYDNIITSLELAGAVSRILRDSIDINDDIIRIVDFLRILQDNIDVFEAFVSTKIGPDKAAYIIMQLIRKEIDIDMVKSTIKMELAKEDIDNGVTKL